MPKKEPTPDDLAAFGREMQAKRDASIRPASGLPAQGVDKFDLTRNYKGKPNHSGGIKQEARDLFGKATVEGAMKVLEVTSTGVMTINGEEIVTSPELILKATELATKNTLAELLPVTEERFVIALAKVMGAEIETGSLDMDTAQRISDGLQEELSKVE